MRFRIEIFLLAIACGYNLGCHETATAYYLYNPYLQQSVKTIEKSVNDKLGYSTVYVLAAVNVLAKREFTVPITSKFAIKSRLNENILLVYTLPL